MTIKIHHYLHFDNDKTEQILESLLFIKQKLNKMAQELEELQAAVQKDTEVDESAITLLNGIKALLDAAIASNNPQALKDLSAKIGASTQRLADAVVANTPAAEPPVEPPV